MDIRNCNLSSRWRWRMIVHSCAFAFAREREREKCNPSICLAIFHQLFHSILRSFDLVWHNKEIPFFFFVRPVCSNRNETFNLNIAAEATRRCYCESCLCKWRTGSCLCSSLRYSLSSEHTLRKSQASVCKQKKSIFDADNWQVIKMMCFFCAMACVSAILQ